MAPIPNTIPDPTLAAVDAAIEAAENAQPTRPYLGMSALGPTEYRLLHFFMEHPERVYSRSQLLDRVWGGNVYVEERTVDVHIRRLRSALQATDHDRLIQTVRGAGYRLSATLE
jgi:DNA-binding response OmpR family regulator